MNNETGKIGQKKPAQYPQNRAKNRIKFVCDGIPLGAAQIKQAVPPLTTPVSLGSSRNLSLKTGKKVLEVKRFDLKFLQISLCRENIKQC